MVMAAPDYLIALDFESTCDENYENPEQIQVTRDLREIIEFPIVIFATRPDLILDGEPIKDVSPNVLKSQDGSFIDFSKTRIVYEYRTFIRPVETPITPYCTQLTGITDDLTANAPDLLSALLQVQDWISSHLEARHSFAFVTHGHFDIRNMLWKEVRRKGFMDCLKPYWFKYFDISAEIYKWLEAAKPNRDPTLPVISVPTLVHKRQRTRLYKLCQLLGVYPSGRLHTGIDDARLIAALARFVIEKKPENVELFSLSCVQNIVQENELFLQDKGRHVLVDSLPQTTTGNVLNAFLMENDIAAPINLWQILDADQFGTGLFVFEFGSHEDCVKFLERCDGAVVCERCILASPLNSSDLDQIKKYLHDVPKDDDQSQSQRVERDKSAYWRCPPCKYANFPNQRVCAKCTFVNLDIPGRPGNWICDICCFDNFAMRFRCFRCKVPHPTKKPPLVPPPPPRPIGVDEWLCDGCSWINRPRPFVLDEQTTNVIIKKGAPRPYSKLEQCFRCDKIRSAAL